MAHGFGNPFGEPVAGPLVSAGVRATPGYRPTPNSVPAGAKTGAPPRTRLYNVQVIPFSAIGRAGNEVSEIVQGTPENRIVILTAPAVGWTIFVGDSGVSPQNGMALLPGQATDIPLPGLQSLFAVTDAPVYLQLQILTSIVLLAEQARKT